MRLRRSAVACPRSATPIRNWVRFRATATRRTTEELSQGGYGADRSNGTINRSAAFDLISATRSRLNLGSRAVDHLKSRDHCKQIVRLRTNSLAQLQLT